MTDGLAKPIDYAARYAEGLDRVLVLGGGGLYFVGWQVGYLGGLSRRGVDFMRADRVVGTSAGSLIAGVLTAGHLGTFTRELNILSKAPALLAALAPATDLFPSQQRALDIFRSADNADSETVRAIGHAALSAQTPRSEDMRRNLSVTMAKRKWPSPALHTVCVDTYTGERIVADQDAGISLPRAVAASSAVPGLFAPQPIEDRLCMDGGVSGSGTHCDLASGAGRAMVLSLGSEFEGPEPMMTVRPGSIQREVARLQSGGTTTFLRGPQVVDVATLMSPEAVPDAMRQGDIQAAKDAIAVRHFWEG